MSAPDLVDNPQLCGVIQYLGHRELPGDEREAQKIILEQSNFTMLDGMLYHIHQSVVSTLHLRTISKSWRKTFVGM